MGKLAFEELPEDGVTSWENRLPSVVLNLTQFFLKNLDFLSSCFTMSTWHPSNLAIEHEFVCEMHTLSPTNGAQADYEGRHLFVLEMEEHVGLENYGSWIRLFKVLFPIGGRRKKNSDLSFEL